MGSIVIQWGDFRGVNWDELPDEVELLDIDDGGFVTYEANGEKKMMDTAKSLLVTEIDIANQIKEQMVEDDLEEIFS